MSSMVRELQASLTNPQNDILASLRSAHIIASKLKLVEIDKWILQELNGYTNVNAESIPKYRVVKGRLMAMNPVNGWIPVQFSDDAFADILKTKYIGVSMSELVTLCNSLNGDTAVIYLTDKQSRQLCEMTDAGFIMDCGLHINKSQLQAIIDNVKNHLLEWTLELEEKGVLGEGLCFSKSETTAAQTVSSSTNYFFGSVVQGNVTNSQISTGNKNELTYNADKAKDATNAIRKQVELEDISNVDKSDIYEMIDDINDKIDQKKRSGVIRSMIVGLKDFCIQAGANITAALVVEQLFQL